MFSAELTDTSQYGHMGVSGAVHRYQSYIFPTVPTKPPVFSFTLAGSLMPTGRSGVGRLDNFVMAVRPRSA